MPHRSPDGIAKSEIPSPKPGTAFATYRLKGEKTWRANVVLSDGHREDDWQSGETVQSVAIAKARVYSRNLAKARGAPTYLELRRQKGELNASDRWNANRAAEKAGKPLPFPPGDDPPKKKKLGRPPGSKSTFNGHKPLPPGPQALVPIVAEPDETEWKPFVRRHEERCVIFFHRVSELFVVEAQMNPTIFVQNIRAMVVEAFEGSLRKSRGRPATP